jgi:hypothetical protein
MSNNLCRGAVYTSGFSFTRVMIHAFCLLRRPGKAGFFLAGMRREFSFLHQRCQPSPKMEVLPRPLSPMQRRLAATQLLSVAVPNLS